MQKHEVFWAEICPSEHFVQMYESETVLLDALEAYVGAGLVAGDSVITIATEPHRKALEARLSERAIDIASLRSRDQYIALDAEQTLSRLMVGGWPDEGVFTEVVTELFGRAKLAERRVRLFGEAVAILWASGNRAATVELERLWNCVCETETLSVFCAYPQAAFTFETYTAVKQICGLHSKVIDRLIAT